MEINTMSITVSLLTTQTRSSVNEKELDWLTLSCLSNWIAVDAFAILTVCTTKLQMHPIQHNTLKSNFISFTGTSVEKLSILLPLIFHPSSGLSVVLGTRRKAGSWGWSGVRKTVKRLLNYRFLSAESAQWENCPRGEKREAEEAADSWLGWFVLLSTPPLASMEYIWAKPSIAPCTKSWDGRVKAALPLVMYLFCSLCCLLSLCPNCLFLFVWLGI